MRSTRFGVLALVTVLGLTLVGVDRAGWHAVVPIGADETPSAAVRDTAVPAAGTLARIAEAVKPAVVNIKTQGRGMTRGGHGAVPGGRPPSEESSPEDFMRRFFGGVPEPHPQRGLGSGVIIDASGIALTNAHLVENTTRIEVVTVKGDTYSAKVLGTDTATDLAVLQLDDVKGPLPTVPLADSDAVRVGDWVLAVGSPFGLQSTVTAGIVSGKARHIGAGPFDDFLQTDAAINPGNSGGPLVNMAGHVIGINTAIVAGGSGIGFAIPSNMVKRIGQELRDKGRVSRGWLGVSIQPLTPELAKSFGVKSEEGALIADVQPGSPAARAGLAAGDVVLELDGKPVKDAGDMPRGIGLAKPGTQTRLKVWRDGAERSVNVTLGEAPSAERRAEERPSPAPPTSGLGLAVRPLTPDVARELQTQSQDGVVVAQVAPRSAAARAGIRPGDIVREVNRRPVKTVEDFERTTQGLKDGDVVTLRLERQGSSRYVAITVGAA